jgi:hypothetical protein
MLLVHEIVKALVKVSPHFRVKMDSCNTLGMRRGWDIVSKNKGPGQSIQDDVFQVEEERKTASNAPKGPGINSLKKMRLMQ